MLTRLAGISPFVWRGSSPNLLATGIASFVDHPSSECQKPRVGRPSSFYIFGSKRIGVRHSTLDRPPFCGKSQRFRFIRPRLCSSLFFLHDGMAQFIFQGGILMTTERLIMAWIERIDIMLTRYILPVLAGFVGLLAIMTIRWGIRQWQKGRASFRQR